MSELDVFLRWLEASGARFPKLCVAHREGEGRGVCASGDIAPGERVLTVPRRALLTAADAMGSPLGRRIAASGFRGAADDTVLAAFVLDERRSGSSSWKPYLDVLPPGFPSNPLFFDDVDLGLLEGSFLLPAIAERRRALLAEHAALVGAVPELAWMSPADFLWARLVVTSRNFGLTIGGSKLRCLVPMADLMNHRPSPETSWGYVEETGAFAMVAIAPVPSGATVHDSYGGKCNGRFLLNYGFTLDDNDDNHAVVPVALPARAPWRDMKQKILRLSPERGSRGFKVPLGAGDGPAEMLSFLRIACADGGELADLCPSPGFAAGARAPVSAACEERALRLLDAACGEALAAFPTTLADDDALLHAGRLGPNARSAVVMRRGEKQVLSAYRDLARACIPLLRTAERISTAPGARGAYLFEEALRAVRDDPWSVLARAERGLRLNGRPLERAVAWRSPRS